VRGYRGHPPRGTTEPGYRGVSGSLGPAGGGGATLRIGYTGKADDPRRRQDLRATI